MSLPCPNCQTPIGLTLKFIIKNPISLCPHCNTIFNFSVNSEIVKSYKEAISEIEKIKKQYKGTVKFK
jgi:transcription initiation factor IIE alpha subunit